jgi:hypothetical protein
MNAFLDEIGTLLPIHIQIMASALSSEVKKRGVEASPELVEECYEERALGPEYRICFEDYIERLERYYNPDESKAAKRLLRELALSDEPLARSALLGVYHDEVESRAETSDFDLLLNWLRDDFYIEETGAGRSMTFKNKWLRDWWRRYHASGD